ncbi:MAG: DUF1573 domain-containing protein [bacterium]
MNAKMVLLPLVFLTGILAAHGEGSTNAPAVVCLNPVFDFGTVYPDAVVRHSYVLTNQGARTVKLTSVHATCGCTTATAATHEIAPGQTTTVDVEINFKGRRGRQNKSVYAETDDPVNRVVRMEFNGLVMVPIEVKPEGIHFGTIGVDGRVEREVILSAITTNEFHVVSAQSPSTQITVVYAPREAGRKYGIRIISDGPRSLGSFMTAVEVQTDHPILKTILIPVAAFVAGDIVPAPTVLMAIPSPTNAPRTSWINLWSPSGKAFKVTKVEAPDGITTSLNTLTPDRVQLEVKTCGSLTGLGGKTIRIETDLPSLKELVIPIRVLNAKKDFTTINPATKE